MTLGGSGPGAIGEIQVDEATRLVARCLDRGVNLFDTADVYANGASEEALGRAHQGHRHEVLLVQERAPEGLRPPMSSYVPQSGRPDGQPVPFVHGGPGGGTKPN
jgi:predicted aldo/keto reductase-like oxidoreductase